MIRDVALRTCQKRWTIERSGGRGSGISVLVAWYDDDDDIFTVTSQPSITLILKISRFSHNRTTWISEMYDDELFYKTTFFFFYCFYIFFFGRRIPQPSIILPNLLECLTEPFYANFFSYPHSCKIQCHLEGILELVAFNSFWWWWLYSPHLCNIVVDSTRCLVVWPTTKYQSWELSQ